VGFEALVRWDHAQQGMIPPSEFVPIAEETGMISPMGWWILEAACLQLRDWHESYATSTPLTVSVNISGKQFLQRDFVERVKKTVEGTGIKGSDLKLELTESVVIENPAAVAQSLRDLHAFGIELCIDDFGTGYSSLSCLHEFPFNVLKIDRSFIQPLDNDAESLGIVQAIIGLSKNLRLKVIAEGVETEGQMAHLANLRCDFAQGYYIAKPMPAEDVPDYLAKRNEIPANRSGVT
jgi:EAL domain-containing protein (putative c-di-GMP-specific phosphodiesterase class I)